MRLIDFCITQLKAQGPSRTCNESKEEEEEVGLEQDAPTTLEFRKDAGLCCGSRLRKGEVFACVGRNQNLKDPKVQKGPHLSSRVSSERAYLRNTISPRKLLHTPQHGLDCLICAMFAVGGGVGIHPENARKSGRHGVQYVAQCVACAALTLDVWQ